MFFLWVLLFASLCVNGYLLWWERKRSRHNFLIDRFQNGAEMWGIGDYYEDMQLVEIDETVDRKGQIVRFTFRKKFEEGG